MFSTPKPYTAVTVLIDRLTSPDHDGDIHAGIGDLVEAINLQNATGPTEAARAIRKKLKYGSADRQLRALDILDSLISNAGTHFRRRFADEPLLERLRILPTDQLVDQEVKQKCQLLYRQWAAAYKGMPGLSEIASLHTTLPRKPKKQEAQSRVLRETEREAQEDPFGENGEPAAPSPVAPRKASVSSPSATAAATSSSSSSHARNVSTSSTSGGGFFSSSRKDKKSKHRVFSLERERPQIESVIAQATIASTSLLNALKLINRETGALPSADRDATTRFESCKSLRRQVLRYIQFIEKGELLGSLLNANDELVKALLAFELLEKGVEDDSDSETEDVRAAIATGDPHATHRRKSSAAPLESQLAGLRIEEEEEMPPAKPPRPNATPLAAVGPPRTALGEDEDEDDDPFGDQHAL